MSGYARISAAVAGLLLASCTSVSQTVPGPATLAAPALAPAPGPSQPDAGDACRAAVAAAAGRAMSETTVLATETSRAGLAARIALRGTTRPWLCIASPEGIVQNVTYMGEG